MKIIVLAEHDQQTIKPNTYNAMSAAKELGDNIDILIIGEKCNLVAEQASFLGATRILVADHSVYRHQLAENCAELIATLAKDYAYIIAASGTYSKNIMPRVAGLLSIAMISDVIKIISANTFMRPMYAGNILATVRSKDAIKILSIRSTAFTSTVPQKNPSPIEKVSLVIPNKLTTFTDHELTKLVRPELTAAKIVIAGGRGLKSAENFHLIEEIADELGAAVGASRAAVDAGFAPNDYQVGQTGKIIAPDLYIAVGISGAIQHLAGIKDSKIIVVINNDPEAPILKIADYYLLGDLFKILPELKQELKKINQIH